MANPLDEKTGEYVELLNFGESAVDAAGLQIDDGDSTDLLTGFGGGATTIAPGGYALIVDPQWIAAAYSVPPGVVLLTVASTATIGSGLSNSDPLTLSEPGEALVISTYSHPFNPGNGVSVELEDAGLGDADGNWLASPCGRSPGDENCASQPPPAPVEYLLAVTEVMANPLDEGTGEFVELYNYGEVAVDVGGLTVADDDADDLIAGWAGGGTVLEAGQYAVVLDPDYAGDYAIGPDTLMLTIASTTRIGNGLSTTDPIVLMSAGSPVDSFSHPFNPGNGVSVERTEPTAADVAASWASSACAAGQSVGAGPCTVAPPPENVTLVLTEVMANPIEEDQAEFIEIFNAGAEAVDLAGFRISDGDAEEPLQALEVGGATVLDAGKWALILDAEYADNYVLPAGTLLLRTPDTTIGSGLATTDPITLHAPNGGAALDSFAFPFNPGNGISAERLDPSAPDGPGAWIATPCTATPGEAGCAQPPPPPIDPGDVDVVLTEIMSNPLDESTGEYVELYNAATDPVDLAGWVLSDGDAQDTITGWPGGGTVLNPGAYAVVLDKDFAGEYTLPGEALLLTVGNSKLGNGVSTTDPVQLRLPDGVTVVSSFSFPFNPGNGKSVERTANDAPDVGTSWVTSPCLQALGATHDYHSPGQDNCAGAPEEEPEPGGDPPLGGCGMVITELMYDAGAVTDSKGEWVELHNATGEAVDLQGWTLRDFGTNNHQIAVPLPVPAEGWVVLCKNEDPAVNGGLACDYQYSSFTLSNTADSVVLETPSGALADKVSYQGSAPWPDVPSGTSIQLVDACGENDAPGGWVPATTGYGEGDQGTPGAPNVVPQLFVLDPAVADVQDAALGASLRFAPYDDIEDHLLATLAGATSQVRIAVYNMRLDSVVDVLAALVAGGVDVEVLLDYDVQQLAFNDMDDKLVAAGVPVTLVDNDATAFASMHVKWAVIDQTTVVTGSANWTSTAFSANDEVLLTVTDPALAARYLTEWDELKAGGEQTPSAPYAGEPLQALMGPDDDLAGTVVSAIAGAQSRVLVAMFEFKHPALLQALADAKATGVAVACVMSQFNADPVDVALLENAGVTVLLADPAAAFVDMHLKMAVIDGQTVLAGSFNWTQTGANDSDENLVVIESAGLAARTEGRYADLLNTYGPADIAAIGLETGDQAVTFTVDNLTLEPGATLEIVSIGPGAFDPPMVVPQAGLTVSLPAGTHLEYRYRAVGAQGEVVTEGGLRHTFTVPYATGPFVISDVYRP